MVLDARTKGACALPWLHLAERFPEAEIALGCIATTIELRGMADTESGPCVESAEAILGYLAEQGLISGAWPDAPVHSCEAMPFAGAQYAYAPHPASSGRIERFFGRCG